MENVHFIDPYATEEKSSVVRTDDRASALVPGEKFEPAPSPRRGREHEVRRLINDLAVLAAKNQWRAS
jgi:hypothetical protein